MGQLGHTTSMYVHHMHPANACSPTHSPRVFLQFLTRSDVQWHTARRIRKIRLHIIVQHLVTVTSIQNLRQRPIANVRCCAERFHQMDFGTPK